MTPDEVLECSLGPSGSPPLAGSSRWYKKDPAFDEEIKQRFEGALQRATQGELEDWKRTPRGRLAFVILLDQFSRNIYRDTPLAFDQDLRAQEAALQAIATGDDKSLDAVERSFLYMPLMHAEELPLQHKCVAMFEGLRNDAPEALHEYVDSSLGYAKRHRDIVERFGRFPHRNNILGRTSTGHEIEFLREPGSSF